MKKVLMVAGFATQADQEYIARKLGVYLKTIGEYEIQWAPRTPNGRPSVEAKHLGSGQAEVVRSAIREVFGPICTFDLHEEGARLTS